ncbi:hypothetical protein [Pedobacter immunditicola]|uniref:hypothetical protein n=1 Tax=Pedobacter immunditicola TaxID=3133440 RepID=UPI0030B721FB
MEIAFITATALLVVFVILALFDGLYLHLIRYKLHVHKESRNEHISHTIRAILFPIILYVLYLGSSDTAFYLGMGVVVIDILVLGADAYMEKDSRAFMGGLPRWEYILHLIVNGFHFASIAVFIVIKVHLNEKGVQLVHEFQDVKQYHLFITIVQQLIPGGILMGLLHFALLSPKPALYYYRISRKLKCC